MDNWIPIEGTSKQRRMCTINTFLSKKRADHRNAILKDWAQRIEPTIDIQVPEDYISPFDTDKCLYCLSPKIGPTGDEFRPSTQRGRQNKINCVPCCGQCNSSKQDKCGSELIKWIKSKSPVEQYEKIIKWYQNNEKYMLIPEDTIDIKNNKLYKINLMELDSRLNYIYEDLS
jgi:5-methylcytosine-specific restriction endonuclease McrA